MCTVGGLSIFCFETSCSCPKRYTSSVPQDGNHAALSNQKVGGLFHTCIKNLLSKEIEGNTGVAYHSCVVEQSQNKIK